MCTAEDDPSSCRLEEVMAVLSASEPMFHGNSAEVVVRATYRSRVKKHPVGWAAWIVKLEKVDCRWQTTGWRLVGGT